MPEDGTFDDCFSDGDFEIWPEPVPLGPDLLPVPRLDAALLPDVFRPWLLDVADLMQAPLEFPAAAALVAAGGAIGRRCGIKPQAHTDWSVVPNIWGALVGRPAMMKSPSMAAALAHMHKLEAEAAVRNQAALKDFDHATQVFEVRQKALAEDAKRRLKSALKKGDPSADLDLPALEPPERPRLVRHVIADATYEKAGEILADNPMGILVVRDELDGFLRALSREDNAAARAFWLEAWNGTGGYTFDRIMRGTVRLEACCAGVIGGIQPSKVASYLKEAIAGGAGDDGLIQRFGLLVYPDIQPDWRNVDRSPDTSAKLEACDAFARLVRLNAAGIGATRDMFDAFPCLRFSHEALSRFEDWRDRLERELRSEDLHPALESHFAKYRKLVPSLALIFHLVDHERGGPVSASAIERACAWAEYLKPHAYRTYATMSQPERAGARTILARIRRGDLPRVFAVRDIQQKGWAGLGTAEITRSALEILAVHKVVRMEAVPHSRTGGRPAEKWTVNPRVK
jgi:hypothetical protein